ncbi:MAG: GyrI-like domain-containing protein [Clostridiales bacterium]|nr:GyrI-like domain-containing protein [Clostridiales bacterium]
MPKPGPAMITVPRMNYAAVRGHGDPNEEAGDYKTAIGLLYAIAFTVRMSRKNGHPIDGYFDYVVPPLEGFWRMDERLSADAVPQNGRHGSADDIDYAHKENFDWISVIRFPDFVTENDFRWAVKEAAKKKKQDFSRAEFLTVEEGLCVQCLHIGSYDDEPATAEAMHRFMEDQGYALDLSDQRMHHEIYLSDARKTSPGKMKTVIRHPVRIRA